MKAFLVVVSVVILINVIQSEAYHTLGLERQNQEPRQEPLTNSVESKEEEQKKEEEESAPQTCCSPKSFQGTIQRYQPGFSDPLQERFFVDSGKSCLATISGPVRRVIICSCCFCTLTTIVESTKSCQQYMLRNVSFDDVYNRCVPQKATRLGTIRMGGQQSSMVVQQWAFSSGSSYARMLVTANGCLPVADITTNTFGPCQSALINTYYFDIASPVKDSRVFAIPPYCRRAAEEVDEKADLKSFYLRFK